MPSKGLVVLSLFDGLFYQWFLRLRRGDRIRWVLVVETPPPDRSTLTGPCMVVRSSGPWLRPTIPTGGAQGDVLTMSGCFPVAGLRCLSRVSGSSRGSLRMRPQLHVPIMGWEEPYPASFKPALTSIEPPLVLSFHRKHGSLMLSILQLQESWATETQIDVGETRE